jgi:hypothetical protein
LLHSCGGLEKEIELELPEYEPKLIVECYLQPGNNFNALLTKSKAYFDSFNFETTSDFLEILEEDAEVTIRFNDEEIVLENELTLNPFTGKIFNYVSDEIVPFDFESDFELEIQTKDGKIVRGLTRISPKVPIDSVIVEFDENRDTLARTLVYFQDDLNTQNFYRRVLHLGSLENEPEFYFQTDDDFVEDGTVVFGSGFDYVEGDTIYNTIYNISQDYYSFLESIEGAVDANGSPFAQPGAILSNLEGDENALGIFTGFSLSRVRTIVEK